MNQFPLASLCRQFALPATIGLGFLLFANPAFAAELDWTQIEIDDALSSFHVAKAGGGHAWENVGEVKLDTDNPTLLTFLPGTGVIANGRPGKTANLFTNLEHGDCELHIEFNVPRGSNSGVYFMGHYEIQVLDSYGVAENQLKFSDCGGIYQRYDEPEGRGWEGHAPPRNASKAPGEWQSFEVIFRAPKFDASGKKIANAKFEKVLHNGVLLHENVEVTGPTRAHAPGPERSKGHLMFQGDHGPVAYRNIRIKLLD